MIVCDLQLLALAIALVLRTDVIATSSRGRRGSGGRSGSGWIAGVVCSSVVVTSGSSKTAASLSRVKCNGASRTGALGSGTAAGSAISVVSARSCFKVRYNIA